MRLMRLMHCPRLLKFRSDAFALLLVTLFGLGCVSAAFSQPYRIQVLSDLHYPAKTFEATERHRIKERKDAALATLAKDASIDLVVILGDSVALTGAASEMQAAKHFLASLPQRKLILAGNHELIYCPTLGLDGVLVRGAPEIVRENKARFTRIFETPLRGSLTVPGGFRLLYLAGDEEDTTEAVRFSEDTLRWLDQELASHASEPTLVFCHAPLWGTLPTRPEKPAKPHNFAQPAAALQAILKRHPQVIAWVSGHTHTKATAKGFSHPVNRTAQGVLNIHNPSWERNHLYANSLFLDESGVTIRTYDFEKHQWVESLKRHLPRSRRGFEESPSSKH